MCKNSLGMTTYTTDYIKTTRDITGMKTCIKDHQPKSKLYIHSNSVCYLNKTILVLKHSNIKYEK